MRCPECDNTDYSKLHVVNDGFSAPSNECLVCGTKWTGTRNVMGKGDLPSKPEGEE